jgi:hypothetical protein
MPAVRLTTVFFLGLLACASGLAIDRLCWLLDMPVAASTLGFCAPCLGKALAGMFESRCCASTSFVFDAVIRYASTALYNNAPILCLKADFTSSVRLLVSCYRQSSACNQISLLQLQPAPTKILTTHYPELNFSSTLDLNTRLFALQTFTFLLAVKQLIGVLASPLHEPRAIEHVQENKKLE